MSPRSLALLLIAVALHAAPARADELTPLPSPLRLEHVTALARAGRAEILAARARAEAASARPAIVSALDDPTVSASLDHVPFMLGGVDASLIVEQRFPLSRVRRHRRHAAEADARRLAADVDRVALDVEQEAAQAFLMLREERAMAAILADQRALADQLVRAATARYAAGQTMQADVLRAELSVARLDGELAASAASITGAEAMLNTTLGRPPDAPVPALADLSDVSDVAAPPPPVADLIRTALAARPELRGGVAEVDRARADVSVMTDMYRPMAMVQTGPAYSMSDGAGWMVMVGISVPIWRDKLRAGVDEAESMTRMASYDLVAMQRMIAGEVAAAHASLLAARTRWLSLRDEVVPRARAAIDPTLAAYTTGDVPLVSVLDMLDEAAMTRMSLVRAARLLGDAHTRLARATAAP